MVSLMYNKSNFQEPLDERSPKEAKNASVINEAQLRLQIMTIISQ